ncbi:MAG: hypothetical protein JKY45_09100 [Emcibacter sp.]|nr:hypothetical protein [Emcibacter sp.]
MNILRSTSGEYQPSEPANPVKTIGQKTFSIFLSLIPWSIVAGLLWAGIFIKPQTMVEVVIPPAIEKRDNIFGISVVTAEKMWLVGNYGKILHSEDGGKNWVRQTAATRRHLQDISAWNDQTAVVVGNGGVIFITADGGGTWTEVEAPKSKIANKLIRVHTYAGGEAWAVGELGMILHSEDYGQSWTRMREEEDVIMNDLIKLDDNRILVVGEYGRLFQSRDKGKTWQDNYTASPSSLTAIDFRTPLDGVIVGLDGAILVTGDAGETWSLIDKDISGITEHLMDVQWSELTELWVAVGNKGKWIKFSGDLKNFQAGSLSSTDLSSHTELAIVKGGFITVGANVGYMAFETNHFTDF